MFHSANGRWPSTGNATSSDIEAVKIYLRTLQESYKLPDQLLSNIAVEVVRYRGFEIHSISALVGGIASQEAVKLITHQYICINNTYLFNGIAGCGCKYEL